MESLIGRTKGDLINDRSCRQERRPVPSRPSGKAFEDLGSTQYKTSAASQLDKRTRNESKTIPPFTGYAASDSDDEIDFLSQSEHSEQGKKTKPKSNANNVIDPKGVVHEFHPNYRPDDVLKKLKFKKNKKEEVAQPEASSSNAFPSKENGYRDQLGSRPGDIHKGPTRRLDEGDIHSAEWDVLVSGKGKKILRETSPNTYLPAPRTQSSSQNDTGNNAGKRSLVRPVPRPVKPRTTSQAKTQDSAYERDKQSKPLPQTRTVTPTKPALDPARTRIRKNKPSKAKEVEYVPGDSQLSSLHSEIEDAFSDEASMRKGKKSPELIVLSSSCSPNSKAMQKSKLKKSDTAISDFPMPSPQSSPTHRKPPSQGSSSGLRRSGTVVEAFPMPSPQSSQVWGEPGKSRKAPRRSPDAERDRSPPRIQPFPMSTQLSGLDSNDTPTARPFRPRKRGSDYDSDGHDSKRRRDDLNASPGDTDVYDEDDSIFISSTVDPRTLCPYCDSLLPSSPSQYFQRLLTEISKKSRPDPRPANPLGRKAPMGTFIAACQRHRFESHILPEAERKGWPKTIDWKKLVGRVEQLKDVLHALIDDPSEDASVDDDDDDDGFGGPRSKCVFWREVMKEVKMKGSRAAAGVRGQFANFEKAQPGYYGELGSVIIYQTLFNLFPPSSFDSTSIAPLTVTEFTQRVLVPEVAVRLIMEDMRLQGETGMKTAIRTLRESSTYGVTMFPDDAGERKAGDGKKQEEGLDVGDRIVMERARKRRKELEEEEDREERQLQKSSEKFMVSKDKGKGKQREINSVERHIPVVVKSRPQPRPVTKTSSSANVLNAVTDVHANLLTRHTMGTKNAYDTDPGTDNEANAIPKRLRRSPSASESTPSRRRPLKMTSSQNIPQSFSTGNSGSDMDIYPTTDTDDDPSMVSRKDRSRKQAGRSTRKKLKKAYSEPDRDEVEIVASKTPLAKRTSKSIVISDEETPKPTRIVFESSTSTTPPLERARKRKAKKSGQETPWSHSMHADIGHSDDSIAPTRNEFHWLLSDSSRDSLDNH